MNALVVFQDQEIRELVIFVLENYFDMVAKAAQSPDEAIKFLNNDDEAFDVILCVYQDNAKKIITHSISKTISLHFICFADVAAKDAMLAAKKEWIHFVQQKNIVEGIAKKVPELFKEYQSKQEIVEYHFCKISAKLLLLSNPLPGGVYLKLSDQKFVRIMREAYNCDGSDMDYFFVKKKLPSLYIKKNDVDKFAKIIESNIYKNRAPDASSSHVAEEDSLESKRKRLENLKAKAQALKEAASEIIEIKKTESQLIPAQEGTGKILNDNRASLIQERAKQIIALQNQKKIQLSEADKAAQEKKRKLEAEKRRAAIAMQIEKSLTADLESIQEMGNKLGFTPEVQTITKKSVAKTIEAVRNAPKLSALLLQIRKEKDKYISAHSMLLAYISCALATKMEWSSETTYQKLTLAAFLHDAHLINHELAKIETLSELEKKMNLFSPEEIKAFKEHPIIAAEIARKFHEVPPDVDSIVAQHHERPDGSGFPRGLSHTRIGPLTSVFIVAHDIVSYLFKNDKVDQGNVSFNQFILENQGMYQFGNFKKVLLAVPKIQT